ncbi:MAG: HhH-GPD-type base excision DNA repair protein [Nocardioides sp.]
MTIQITGDPHADRVLSEDPFALLLGMLLDQQYPMEHAFRGPAKLLERCGTLAPAALAAADPQEFAAICAQTPAVHRFPGSMAARIQALAAMVEERYDGQAARVWTEAASGRDLLDRVRALPGFGVQKSQIFVALLAKQLGVRPAGWEVAVGGYAEPGFRSVADVTDPVSLQKVRDYKKAQKGSAQKASTQKSSAQKSSAQKNSAQKNSTPKSSAGTGGPVAGR